MGRNGRRIAAAALCVLGALPATAGSAAAQDAAARYRLANGCYAIEAGGRLVAKDGAGGYTASASDGGSAEAFRMQATTLGQYLLYGRARDFLSTDNGRVVSEAQPSPSSDWKVDTADGDRFTLRLASTGKGLAVADGKLVIADTPTPLAFTRSEGCQTFPEPELNATGEPFQGPTDYGEVRGMVDAHMHMMAFEFLGGRAHCGRPWSPFGAPDALVDCPDHFSGVAPLETALKGKERHDPVGWPTFKDWPDPRSLTHESSYYRWVERAWRGGLRVFVNLFVDNAALCKLYPFKADRPNVCNEMATVRLEHRRIHELQDYIDAQHGGPGKGWFRIVTDPIEAREVINDGKLAVVLGIEISQLFDCGLDNGRPLCDREQIDRNLDEVYKLGVRDMELVNKFDNALGGVAGDEGSTGVVTNSGNRTETGRYWDMQTCTGPPGAEDKEQSTTTGHNTDALLANGLATYAPAGTAPVYPAPPHCNTLGLSDLGAHLVNRMADKGMLIDPDHLSVLARNQLLSVLEARRYSGVVSSHSWSTPDSYPRIYKLGGFIAPYAGSSEGFVKKWKETKPMRDGRFYFGFGYGADMNGFGSQGLPRGADAPNKVEYPFKSFDGGTTFDRQRSGERVFDINTDGVAHYGLYPDWVEDLRKLGGQEIVDDMARGAEAYLQTWERAEGIRHGWCEPARQRVRPRGARRVALHRTPAQLLRAIGQPVSRPLRAYRWRVCGGGETVAAFTSRGRSGLVGSTARGWKIGGLGPGARASRLRGARRFGRTGVRVRRAGRGGRYVYGVRKGRISWVAVASRSVGTDAKQLRRHLRLAGLR
jgi:microsomal dipeptidase-like Zn-dependent dipeptidase